jgi:hypothetical protein
MAELEAEEARHCRKQKRRPANAGLETIAWSTESDQAVLL